jgi:hypothetical protein
MAMEILAFPLVIIEIMRRGKGCDYLESVHENSLFLDMKDNFSMNQK